MSMHEKTPAGQAGASPLVTTNKHVDSDHTTEQVSELRDDVHALKYTLLWTLAATFGTDGLQLAGKHAATRAPNFVTDHLRDAWKIAQRLEADEQRADTRTADPLNDAQELAQRLEAGAHDADQ